MGMIANLMCSGLLEKLPDLKICVARGGGFVPYQIGRLEHGQRVRPETRRFAKTLPKSTDVHFDMGDEEPMETIGAVPQLTPREHDTEHDGVVQGLLVKGGA